MKQLYFIGSLIILLIITAFVRDNGTASKMNMPLAGINDTFPSYIPDTIITPIVADTIVTGIDTISSKENDTVYINTGKILNGIASYYSRSLEGTQTATGELFRHSKMTAASNNFKLNTWVRITNLKNNKSIVVRINDRMHPAMAKKGRVVDLTMTGAKTLDFVNAGLAKVKVEEIKMKTADAALVK